MGTPIRNDAIFGTRNGLGNIGHPRVRLKRGSEFDKVGRLQPSFIEIEGDKMWIEDGKNQLGLDDDPYKKTSPLRILGDL